MPEMVVVEVVQMVVVGVAQMAAVMIESRMRATRKAKSRTKDRSHLEVVVAEATMMVVATTLMSRSSGQLGPSIALSGEQPERGDTVRLKKSNAQHYHL